MEEKVAEPMTIKINLEGCALASPAQDLLKHVVESSSEKMGLERYIMRFLPLVKLFWDTDTNQYYAKELEGEKTDGLNEVLAVAAEVLAEEE